MIYSLLILIGLLSCIPTFYGMIGTWRCPRNTDRRAWYNSIWAIGSLLIAITPVFSWLTFILNILVFIITGFSVLAHYSDKSSGQEAYEAWKTMMKNEWKSFKERTQSKIERIMPL